MQSYANIDFSFSYCTNVCRMLALAEVGWMKEIEDIFVLLLYYFCNFRKLSKRNY